MSGPHLRSTHAELLLLGALVPLVALYILKTRPGGDKPISSTWLNGWSRNEKLLAKKPFRRLIAEVPLAFEVIALVACRARLRASVGADAIDGCRPRGNRHRPRRPRWPPAWDGRTGRPRRIDEAKRVAADVLSHLSSAADAFIVTAGQDADVVGAAPNATPAWATCRDLATVDEEDVEGSLGPALALAADRLRSLGGHRRLVVITDGALAREEPLAVAGIPTQVLFVGDSQENAGIVGIDVRSGIDGATHAEQIQVFALVQSWGTRPRDVSVSLIVEGRAQPVSSTALSLKPNDSVPVILTFNPSEDDHGAGLMVKLTPNDAEDADDVAFGQVPQSARLPVVHCLQRISRIPGRHGPSKPTKTSRCGTSPLHNCPRALSVRKRLSSRRVGARTTFLAATFSSWILRRVVASEST